MDILLKNEIESKLGKSIIEIDKTKYGGANLVYNIMVSDKCQYVLKIYKRPYDFSVIMKLNKYLKDNGIETLDIIERGTFHNNQYYLYKKNAGIHKNYYNKNMIDNVLDVINIEYMNKKDANHIKNSIIIKYGTYRDYFLKNNVKRIPIEVIKYINKVSKKIDLDFKDFYLIHGDLSITNLLWVNNNVSVIDFDEATYAPIEYELCSLIMKVCFNNSKFNKPLAKIIMKEIKNKFENVDYYSLRNCWNLYITKVIYEKFYFYELGYIDIETKEHKKDYWKWWYGILGKTELFDEIFFDEYRLSKIEMKNLIKDDEKSSVGTVTLGKNKFILKRSAINVENDVEKEKRILEELQYEVNVPRVLKIEKNNMYEYKLYTYMNGEHRLQCTEQEEKNC